MEAVLGLTRARGEVSEGGRGNAGLSGLCFQALLVAVLLCWLVHDPVLAVDDLEIDTLLSAERFDGIDEAGKDLPREVVTKHHATGSQRQPVVRDVEVDVVLTTA